MMSRTQLRALQILADGPALQSNVTDTDARTVAWRTVRSLEGAGLVIDVAGYKAILTAAGREVAANLPEPPPLRYEHGTHACYVLDGCRCRPCGYAAHEYEARRSKDNAYGRPRTVDAEPVREHVRSLMAPRRRGATRGMGWKRIAKVAGVSNGAMTKLLWSVDGKPPSRRVRTSTAERLLAVRLELADGATIKAAATRKLLDEMIAGGFCKAELGRYLTGDVRTRALQIGQRRYVTVANAEKVTDLHARWKSGEIVPRGRWNNWEHGPPSPFPATPAPPRCEDCGAEPWQGGRWCWDDYQAHRRAA